MDLNRCNNCGGTYEYRGGRYVCRACGSYRYENLSDEEKKAVQEAAQILFAGDFDGAEEAFGKIIFRYPTTAEAYWGRLKAHYRVLYGQDLYGKMTPISCEPLKESVLLSLDYRKAIGFSDLENARFLKAQSEVIEGLRVISDRKEAMKNTASLIPEEASDDMPEEIFADDSEEALPIAGEEDFFETEEAHKESHEIPEKQKSKAGRKALALLLVVVAVIGINAAFANAHSKKSTGNTNQLPNMTSYSTTSYATTTGGDFTNPTPSVSNGLLFTSNGDGTCTLIGVGSCKDSDLVIPSTYNGMRVTHIGYSAFYSCTRFKSVTIPESVTNIGTSAFKLCSNLTTIYYEGTTEQWKKNVFGASWDSGTGAYTVRCSDGTVAKNG